MTTLAHRSSPRWRRRALARAGLLAAGALALVACGASPAASPTQAPVPTPGPSASTPASGAATPTNAPATPATATAVPAAKPTAPAPAAPVTPTPAPAASASPTTPANLAATPVAAATPKLNLNTATREQFLGVPGVGDRMVREFLEYRPYRSIQQFRREIGKYVPREQVTAYERYVFVPVDPNSADAETLQQLPGVDAAIATQLTAGRPYASSAAFLTTLGQHLSADQVTVARGYLATP